MNNISIRGLTQTKLEKKATYEDIINIVEPELIPKIPRRKALDKFSSHFNISYAHFSDERLKELEKQMLLEKFSKHYGLNLAAVQAYATANNLVPIVASGGFQSPSSSAQEEPMGGGYGSAPPAPPPSGSGLIQSAASVASALGAALSGGLGSLYTAGASSSSGNNPPPPPPMAFAKAAPLSGLLSGNPSQQAREALRNRFMTDQEYQEYLFREQQEREQEQRVSVARTVLLTPHQPPQSLDPSAYATVSQSPIASSSSSSSKASEPEEGIYTDPQVIPSIYTDPKEFDKFMKQEMVNIIGWKQGNPDLEYNNDDYIAAFIISRAEVKARAEQSNVPDIKQAAQKLLQLLNKVSGARPSFRAIAEQPEYKMYSYLKYNRNASLLNAKEKQDYIDNIVEEYNMAPDDIRTILYKLPNIRKYLTNVSTPHRKSDTYSKPLLKGAGYSSPPSAPSAPPAPSASSGSSGGRLKK
jgi:hypothetical protein